MRRIKKNTVYMHFSGNLYLVLDIAINYANGEKVVIYRGLYNDNKLYTLPLERFLEKVDYTKNPEIKQKYKFEEITIEKMRR